jgi:hypothetical protein
VPGWQQCDWQQCSLQGKHAALHPSCSHLLRLFVSRHAVKVDCGSCHRLGWRNLRRRLGTVSPVTRYVYLGPQIGSISRLALQPATETPVPSSYHCYCMPSTGTNYFNSAVRTVLLLLSSAYSSSIFSSKKPAQIRSHKEIWLQTRR